MNAIEIAFEIIAGYVPSQDNRLLPTVPLRVIELFPTETDIIQCALFRLESAEKELEDRRASQNKYIDEINNVVRLKGEAISRALRAEKELAEIKARAEEAISNIGNENIIDKSYTVSTVIDFIIKGEGK